MSLVGQTLDIYALGEELGRGGMGAVYRAETVREGPAGPAGSVVAVKVFHPHLVANDRARERFVREAEIGQQIQHANVVRTFVAGCSDVRGEPCHYMVMEFVDGQTLEGLREELGTVPDHLLYLIADQSLAGLDAIHAHGIVHRDIKPANIVITTTHKVLLMDLGVARMVDHGFTMTEQGEFVGSLHYAAPEQLGDESEIRAPSDLYSFGIVLYELATGRLPYDAQDLPSLLRVKLQADVSPPRTVMPELDPFWDEIITTCLERSPANRFRTAEELRTTLQDGRASAWWRERVGGREPSGAERALARLRLEREAPFIGRDGEMSQLREAYGLASGGEGSLQLVAGASGSGKSRLVFEFLEDLSSVTGPRVGAGRAAGRGGRAYQPFLEAAYDLLALEEIPAEERRAKLEERLAEMLPDRRGVIGPFAAFLLGDQGGEEGPGLEKDALLAAYDGVLQHLASNRPLVLVIEDLHLAGDDTLDLLTYLRRTTAERPVLFLGVYDDEPVQEDSALDRLIQTVTGDDAYARLQVEPLTRSASDDLMRAVVGHEKTVHALGDLLFRRTDGNPLILLEVVARLKSTGALAEEGEGWVLTREIPVFELPRRATDLVHYKLSGLDEDLREVLDAAAVLGHEFRASLVAAMLEIRKIQLLKRMAVLERKHHLIISSGRDQFRFTKRQIGEVLYFGIPPDLRVEYHALAADTYLERHEDDEGPLSGAVAYAVTRHLLEGDRADEVGAYAEIASAHVVSRYHATHARPFLERVAGVLGVDTPAALFAVRRHQWECLGALGRRQEQEEVLEAAHQIAREMDDAARTAQILCLQAVTKWRTGDNDGAEPMATEAVELAREAGDREWEANGLHNLGAIAQSRGDVRGAAARWNEALGIRRESGDRNGEARSLASLGFVMPQLGERENALAAKEEALAIFRELGDRRRECAMLNNIGNTLLVEGRTDDAMERFRASIEIGRELGSLTAEGHPTCNLGRAYVVLGDAAHAREALGRAQDLFRAAQSRGGLLDALRVYADACALTEDCASSEAALSEGLELAEASGAKPLLYELHLRRALSLAKLGRDEASQDGFEEARGLAEELGQDARVLDVLLAAGQAAMHADDEERALDLLSEAHERVAGEKGLAHVLACVRLAWVHRMAGEMDEARPLAAEAAGLLGEDLDLPSEPGIEICYVLEMLLGKEEGARFAVRARELVAERSSRIQDPVVREHFLTKTWPARELASEFGATRME